VDFQSKTDKIQLSRAVFTAGRFGHHAEGSGAGVAVQGALPGTKTYLALLYSGFQLIA